MGCGCSGSADTRTAPPPRPPRAGEPSPPLGPSQGAMGEPGYYFTGPPRQPAAPDTQTQD